MRNIDILGLSIPEGAYVHSLAAVSGEIASALVR